MTSSDSQAHRLGKVAGCIFLLCLFLFAASESLLASGQVDNGKKKAQKKEKSYTKEKASQIEKLKRRWQRLSPRERARLRKLYREYRARLPQAEWEKLRRMSKLAERPPLNRFPKHWREFLIAQARWARSEIEKLPPEEKEKLKALPLELRTKRIKRLLRPLFRKRLQACRSALTRIFTPFEIRILMQLSPEQRIRLLRAAKEGSSGLISPQSLVKLRSSKESKLVEEFLLMPEGLGTFPARLSGLGRRTKRPKKFIEAKENKVPRKKKLIPSAESHKPGTRGKEVKPHLNQEPQNR